MKKNMRLVFVTIILITIISSCIQRNKLQDHIILSGKIENSIPNQKIIIRANQIDLTYDKSSYKKILHVDQNGHFADTLELSEREYDFTYGKFSSSIYLKNGFDLKINFDAENPTQSLKYNGIGYEQNQFNADQQKLNQELIDLYSSTHVIDFNVFAKKEILKRKNESIDLYKGIIADPILDKKRSGNIQLYTNPKFLKKLRNQYEEHKAKKELSGSLAPNFYYENQNGDLVNLEGFLGKYVYIDIWATWCGPCKAQEPYFKEIYNQFKNKNIEFVSISIDMIADKDKWFSYVRDKQLPGIHLFENQNSQSDFIKAIKVNTVPRYILIDPTGKIFNTDAPRPSSQQKLITLFKSLGL